MQNGLIKGISKDFSARPFFDHFWSFFVFLLKKWKNGQKWLKTGLRQKSLEIPFINPYEDLFSDNPLKMKSTLKILKVLVHPPLGGPEMT